MVWVNIIAAAILLFSFVGGFKEGAVKNAFSLIALLIAIPVTGVSYHLLASAFSFLPGENWENFVGFFITMGLIMAILYFVLLIPRRLIQKVWNKGILFRLIGGTLNAFNAAIGLVIFTILVVVYPIFGSWLAQAVMNSSILSWLAWNLKFIFAMLSFTKWLG